MGVAIFGFKILDDDGCFSIGLLREILAEILGTFLLIVLGCGGDTIDAISFLYYLFLLVAPNQGFPRF
jgi:hypothetical protein